MVGSQKILGQGKKGKRLFCLPVTRILEVETSEKNHSSEASANTTKDEVNNGCLVDLIPTGAAQQVVPLFINITGCAGTSLG